ncbi:endonuclease/exonuclease/phosphatase family protein [Sphaerisporangium flaviroseum]
MLPAGLEAAFGMLGVPWPTQDEGALRRCAAAYRACAGSLATEVIPTAHGAFQCAAASNAGDGMNTARAFWADYHEDGDDSTHLLNLVTILDAFADGHDLAADLVEAIKDFLIAVAAVVAIVLAVTVVAGGIAVLHARMSVVCLRTIAQRATSVTHRELNRFFGRTLVGGIEPRLRRILGARSPRRINVTSWNIAGARTINSLDSFDYGPENIPYFTRGLAKDRPDLVFLQESHVGATPSDSLAGRLADKLGLPHVMDTPTSISHLDPRYVLANSMLSKSPLRARAAHRLPRPDFEVRIRGEGEPVEPFDRYVQVARVNVNGRDITVANIHTNPLEFLGHAGGYVEGDGVRHARAIERLLLDRLPRRGPLLLVGDFNTDDIFKAYPDLMRKLGLKDALVDVPATVPWGQHPDHILYTSRTLRLIDAAATADAGTDHYRCRAVFRRRLIW